MQIPLANRANGGGRPAQERSEARTYGSQRLPRDIQVYRYPADLGLREPSVRQAGCCRQERPRGG